MKHPIPTALLMILVMSLIGLFSACGQPGEEAVEQAAEPLPPPKPRPGDYVLIPAGEFVMGSNERPEGFKDKPQLHEPEHTVDLPAYEMSVYETTNAEFARFQIESDYQAEGDWRRYYSIDKGDFPVANVTWDDADAYCKWAGGRLPTEAEWEKAGRGSDGKPYPWGDKWDPTKSNCNEIGFRNTVEVGRIQTDVSTYGVHDLMGNVQEWTAVPLKPYPDSASRRDPNYQRGYISCRGGSYAIKGGSIKLWTRGAYLAKSQYGLGFRCVKDVPQEGSQEEAQ